MLQAPAGPIEAFLEKLIRRKQREYVAETASVAITAAGVEGAIEFGAQDAYAPTGAISTNPLLVVSRGAAPHDAEKRGRKGSVRESDESNRRSSSKTPR